MIIKRALYVIIIFFEIIKADVFTSTEQMKKIITTNEQVHLVGIQMKLY